VPVTITLRHGWPPDSVPGLQQGAFDERPLQQLLQQQGLSPALQDVVAYGIAMCTSNQAAAAQLAAGAGADGAAAETGSTGAAAAGAEQQQQPSSSEGCGTPQQACQAPAGAVITAREALKALQLFVQSVGRYGSGGAFMAASYGTGTLPEVSTSALPGLVVCFLACLLCCMLLHAHCAVAHCCARSLCSTTALQERGGCTTPSQAT
jgi:hypothetical protein